MSIAVCGFNLTDGFMVSDTRVSWANAAGEFVAPKSDDHPKVWQIAPNILAAATGPTQFCVAVRDALRGATTFAEAAGVIERLGRQTSTGMVRAALLIAKEDGKVFCVRWNSACGFSREYIRPTEDPEGDAGVFAAIGWGAVQDDIFKLVIEVMQRSKRSIPFRKLPKLLTKAIKSVAKHRPEINGDVRMVRLGAMVPHCISGPDQYTMDTYIRRGQMGTAPASHAAGSAFLRLDGAVFKYTYDPSLAGRPLYFKFQSVNRYGNSPQDLSLLDAVEFVIPGANPPDTPKQTTSVVNGDFEASAELPPYGWSPAPENLQEFDTTTPYQGTRSFKLSSLVGSSVSVRSNQKYLVRAGDTFKLSAALKMQTTGSGTTGHARFVFYGTDDSNVLGSITLDVSPTDTSWTLKAASATAPSGTTYAYIVLTADASAPGAGGGAVCEFDSIQLLRVLNLGASEATGTLPTDNLPARKASITFVIDGGGSVVTTGSKGHVSIPMGCTVNGWVITADASGSAVVDVKRSTYSGFPSTSSIAGSDKPTLPGAQKAENTGPLSSWGSVDIAAGDILEFNVDSCTTCKRLAVTLNFSVPA